ncbi:uncharacterized protein LOC118477769 [Aplysia californica]|uniref:Uncharacterized protein LOC118477769 n=1 Tax=Aplysia californica TaxID=6500 RepID=A0ABM1VU20_APLCA|nr:uncharacterized protein LOC118477769 [Aplysia californica]
MNRVHKRRVWDSNLVRPAPQSGDSEDSNTNYSCVAGDNVGVTLGRIKYLNKKDSPSVQVKRNPEITITGSQFVSSGDDVSLFCNASMLGNPRRALVWLKDSVQVPTEGARVSWGYVVSPNRETLSAKLQITKARPDDSGLYTCRSRDHKLTTSAQVNVQSAGSNNVKRAGSVSQESSAVLSVQCAISNITFLTYMFFVHVLLT